MNYFIIYLLMFHGCGIHAFLNYDRAIVQGQKNNWNKSADLLKQELVQQPDNPELLYDLGVSSYKNGDHEHALSYFAKAAQSPHAKSLLQEQSLFNAGNTQVALKQLEDALKSFDRVLAINPKNLKATHNKEIVKKMLEEQKQQQQQDQNKKNNEDKKDKEQEQQQKDQSDKDSQDKEKNEQNNQQKHDQQSEQDKKNNQSRDQKKSEDQQKQDTQEKSEQDKQESDTQKKDKNAHAQKEHKQENKKENGSNSGGSQEQKKETADQHLSPSMAGMLDEREKKDAQLNKQLMRAMAGSQAGGADHNEHYW